MCKSSLSFVRYVLSCSAWSSTIYQGPSCLLLGLFGMAPDLTPVFHPYESLERGVGGGGRPDRAELSQAVQVCTCPGHGQQDSFHTMLCYQGQPPGSQLRLPIFPFLELSLKWATLGPHLFSYTSQQPLIALPGCTLLLLAQPVHYS